MAKRFLLPFLFLLTTISAMAQNNAKRWADSVYNTLSDDERIAQLMVVRLSTIDSRTKTVTFFDQQVTDLVKKYNIGGVCIFQGSPVKQANIINNLQLIAKTPILMCIDAEWGVGMRMIDSVLPLPKQMMLGAMTDPSIVYQYGRLVGEQCKRVGLQVNYAPVVDVNNNPNNPVINDRSFGEDKYKVAAYAIQYMKGMQDVGVMACAKHFPGHGDVSVDSHYDLPVINKTMQQLDSLELYPFREIFKAGIGSVMIAHLSIPSIDSTANKPTSISKNNVTGLMRDKMGYQGLTFTDALEMQGVKKYYPDGEASVQSLVAGNDMLCLPGDVPLSIQKIKEAIKNKQLTWADIEAHCKKVLESKYQYGLTSAPVINTNNLTADLNSGVPAMRRLVAENALTVLKKSDSSFFPLKKTKETVYVAVGINTENAFAKRLRADYDADVIYFDYKQDAAAMATTLAIIKKKYKKVIVGVHGYNRSPANNFGLPKPAIDLVAQLSRQPQTISFVFGNVYALKNWCDAKNIVACYEDDDIIQNTAADLLQGKIAAKGRLPVTVCDDYKYGSGLTVSKGFFLPPINPVGAKINPAKLLVIDSIAQDAIAKKATPGAVVLVAKDGKIEFYKSYGTYTYDGSQPVSTESIYDMASVTKICATTIAVMKLYDEGKLSLEGKLGDYLPWVKGSNKENLQVKDILLHQAGLVAYIPFYKETIDANGVPLPQYYSPFSKDSFSIRVAENLYMRNDWKDSLYKRILDSKLGPAGKYVYSDNDFIFLGKIVEELSGKSLDEYVHANFYRPLGLTTAGFRPRNVFPAQRIVPTEQERSFRLQLLRGDVHDPGAAMFGGVAGHAGLYSNAYDLAIIMQMLVNGGTMNGRRYVSEETVKLFTAYHSDISRRGYGFDKPEKDNPLRNEAYPALSVSPQTFGHTGFTGTGVWADPTYNLVFIFLSNRVNPEGGDNKKLLNMNVRGKVQEAVYDSMR